MGIDIVAIDGGGTSTTAAISDRAGCVKILNPAVGCNPQDGPGWEVALTDVLGQCPREARIVLGMPGHDEIPGNDVLVHQLLDKAGFQVFEVLNDVALALKGAFPTDDGVLVLSGTGSMAMAQNAGQVHRTGGWGHHFGDEGSAFWIGQRALSLASQELDGRIAETGFAHRLMDLMRAPKHPFGLIDWVVSDPAFRARTAACAKHVDTMSEAGDPVAISILDDAVTYLVNMAKAAASGADLGSNPAWSPAGSVFQSNRIMAGVTSQLGDPIAAPLTALGGGLVHAAELEGWTINDTWIQNIHQALGASV